MMILAIDTSTRSAGIALLKDEDVVAESFFRLRVTHSERVLPAVEAILSAAGTAVEEVRLFAVTHGPGSFTGLRVGAGLAKGMALGTGGDIIGVSTLDALAQNLAFAAHLVCPLLDARKGQVYTSLYRPSRAGGPEKIEPDQAVEPSFFLERIREPVIFVGDGVPVYGRLIREMLPSRAFFAPAHLQFIRPSTVALLGLERHRRGERDDLLTFAPRYLRRSEAEIRSGGERK